MTYLAKINRYIEATSTRLDDLSTRARGVPGSGRGIVQESLIHLATTLEELRVSEEELRVQAERLAGSHAALEAELRRYRDLFEQAPDAYLLTDPDGVICEANAAAAALLGVREDALHGKPLVVFVPEEDRRAFRRQLPWLHETGRLGGWELRLAPRGRDPVRVEVSASPVRGADGAPGELRLVLRDVSRRPPAAAAEALGAPRPETPAAAAAPHAAEPAPVRPEARAWGEALLREVQGTDRRSRASADTLAAMLGRSVNQAMYLGVLRPGDRVPGIREVARATGLNHKTVARAYRTLVEAGVLEVRDRSGVYAAPQGWTDRGPPAGDESWAAEVMTEAWRRRIGVAALPEKLRRWAAAAPLRCAVVESDPARREALGEELREAFGLECVPVAPQEAPGDDDRLAAALREADLAVTTPFHASQVRVLVRALGKPLMVATARQEAAAGGAPLPGLSAETARGISETLVLLNLERSSG